MKATIVAALALSLMAGASGAQNASSCYHSDQIYSVGSAVRMGPVLTVCKWNANAGFSEWVAVSDESGESANCMSGGREFGQGALLVADLDILVCNKGIWYLRKE